MIMILLVGIPASCKTSFYHANFSSNHIHISLDIYKKRNLEKIKIEECIILNRP